MEILLNAGGFCLFVEGHWEGSAPVTCAAGLFQLPFTDIFGGVFAEDEQKSKAVSVHPPNKLKIALHAN